MFHVTSEWTESCLKSGREFLQQSAEEKCGIRRTFNMKLHLPLCDLQEIVLVHFFRKLISTLWEEKVYLVFEIDNKTSGYSGLLSDTEARLANQNRISVESNR